ncbi:efflux transporter outer membrane subunit [Variovorax boronicumulans]|uniref:efflux transporter outer membrane subunit n=1 Tax=Variovorax boronicumulans TaxID=436515 RepID=UPI0009F234FA|nr:efflux transporter outer membrane subunit [Variovorax boronicumulans]
MHIRSFARHFLPRRTLLGASSLLLLGLAGCASAPLGTQSQAPSIQIPSQWSETTQSQGTLASEWWKDLGSPELNSLIRSALDANRDLKVMVARLEQARSLTAGAEADRRPQLSAAGTARRGRDSNADPKTEQSAFGLRAAWEIDVFGRGALAVDAARADAQGAAHALEAARITLAADVASAYFELRTLDARARLARDATQLAQRQTEVTQRKFDAGQATALDVERWRAELAQERATSEQLEGDLRVRKRQLAVLLGTAQSPVLKLGGAIEAPPAPTPVLPGELLERRPDVQRQARALDAALARVGVARREIYPRLQIDWTGSRQRLTPIGGSASPMAVSAYGISVSLPILDGGRIRANVAVQEARVQEAMAAYEQTMLTALADVDASLTRWNAAEASLQEWQRALRAGEVATQRAVRLFDAGLVDLSTVLDARRNRLRAQDAVSQAEGARWSSAVGLRRAFAGTV